MNKRCGITMQCVGNKTERQAKESVRLQIQDYKRRKEEFLDFSMSFVSFRAQKGSVVYDVDGFINEKERCYISVGCCDFQAISSSSSSSSGTYQTAYPRSQDAAQKLALATAAYTFPAAETLGSSCGSQKNKVFCLFP